MSALLRSWARALGGEVSGNSVRAPGPGHSARDRSLSVTPSAAAPNRFLVNSFAGDDWRACQEHVRAALGLPKDADHSRRPRGSRHEPPQVQDAAGKSRALSMWAEAIDPLGTLVEKYLAGRGLELPDKAAGESIRFHADCP